MGSRGGVQSTSNVDLQECFDRLIAEKTAEIDRDEEILLIEKTSSFFSNVLNFISQVYDSKGDVSKILKASSTYINDYSEDLVKEIRAQDKIDKEIQDLLICNLANQRLEAQWIIEVQGESSEFTSTLVESPDFDEELCEFWTYQCQYASYHPDHNTFCENQNMYCGEYIYQLQFEENDFVYTRSEQTIPNLARTYRIEANHLQEQQWDRNKVPLEELYSGDLGPVFRVPKI